MIDDAFLDDLGHSYNNIGSMYYYLGNYEDALINFLEQDDPILTQSTNVKAFEEEWSKWLGVKYSTFVNSGASANLISINILI